MAIIEAEELVIEDHLWPKAICDQGFGPAVKAPGAPDPSWAQFVGPRVHATSSNASSIAVKETSTCSTAASSSEESSPRKAVARQCSTASSTEGPPPISRLHFPEVPTIALNLTTGDRDSIGCTGSNATARDPVGRRFLVRCKHRWRVRGGPGLGADHLGSVPNGTIAVAASWQDDNAARVWVHIVRFEYPEQASVPSIRERRQGMYCLRRNKQGQGLYEIGVEPSDGELQILPLELWSELRDDPLSTPRLKEDMSLTHQVLGVVDSVVQFFSQMAAIPSSKHHIEKSQKLEVPKCKANQLFETRQRQQVTEAAENIGLAVGKLTTAAGTADAKRALVGLAPDICSRFKRLRRLALAAASDLDAFTPRDSARYSEGEWDPLGNSRSVRRLFGQDEPGVFGAQPDGWRPNDPEDDLQRFAGFCATLVVSSSVKVSWELRSELTSFSQRHAQDLERHCRFVRRSNAPMPRKNVMRLIKLHSSEIDRNTLSTSRSDMSQPPALKPPPAPASSARVHFEV